MNLFKKLQLPLLGMILCVTLGSCSIWDFQAPEISLLSPEEGETVGQVFLVSGTVTDNIAVKSINYSLDGNDWNAVEGLEHWYTALTVYEEGNHYLLIQAEDYNGNISAIMFSFLVEISL